jgi:uncharacterized membrane protein
MKSAGTLLKNRAVFSLAVFSVFCCLMLTIRIMYVADPDYWFLVWNLFLAIVPLKLALWFRKVFRQKSIRHPHSVSLLFVWLIFFPNSPYIITDLIHIANSTGVIPVWYDALMIFSFAMCGVYAGFLSLYIIYRSIKSTLAYLHGIAFPAALFLLSAYGIYLGRILRWNSWDLVTRPHLVLADIWSNSTDPSAWGITIFFGCFLMFAWLIFSSFAENEINRITDNESD